MNLTFDKSVASGYKSPAQKARVLTEDWALRNVYCASCDNDGLDAAPVGAKVIDFICNRCSETYQLKSRRSPLGGKVVDAAYAPMMEAVRANKAPNLLLLHYDAAALQARDLIVVPRFFLSASCIEARKPLSANARRAGWIGCNIVLKQLPGDARISVIENSVVQSPRVVRQTFERYRFLDGKMAEARGWTADVLKVVDGLEKTVFTLDDVYASERELSILHPENKHVRAKIRQQLQVLRDRDVIEFLRRGEYRRTSG